MLLGPILSASQPAVRVKLIHKALGKGTGETLQPVWQLQRQNTPPSSSSRGVYEGVLEAGRDWLDSSVRGHHGKVCVVIALSYV